MTSTSTVQIKAFYHIKQHSLFFQNVILYRHDSLQDKFKRVNFTL